LLAAQEDYTRPESTRLKLLGRLTEMAGSAHDVLGLASFLVFLVDGRYRTVTDRLLRLRLTPTSHSTSREVSFEYLNRQLVWHAFTEFLLFLLPLVGISRWRRILFRTFKKLRTTLYSLLGAKKPTSDNDDEEKSAGELGFLPERTCAVCYRDQNPTTASEADVLASSTSGGGVVGSAATDITNPYETIPCGCIYCFACIAQRIANEEGEGWTCLRCGEVVKECRPWNGDIIEEQRPRYENEEGGRERPSTAKSVGFAAGADEKALLREVDPMPEQEEMHENITNEAEEGIMGTGQTRGLDLGDSLFTESSEWARASEERSSSEDEQSEEYDEDEEEEGEELGGFDYDQ
jgi:peroxin-2